MTNAFSLFSTLKDRISSRQARIATVGLGYVGLPLALTISEAGFPTTGIDLNRSRVDAINAGARVISYFAEDRIATAIAGGKFGATADFAVLQEIDVVLICVPTPLSPAREPDLSYVIRAAEGIAKWLRPGQLVVLESTVWPGATATVVKPIFADKVGYPIENTSQKQKNARTPAMTSSTPSRSRRSSAPMTRGRAS